ncbi:putative peptidase c14 caspase catalytic subunit p20 [Rosellinia necatrix]|uniref:Putative peptidase c14 caspase catalytic subunit p20 n=1 Tax=Rosellinia necatrix TaxID=77044 RepID=A0A1S8A601_ROSNE|nr:putative peptidase c14 caspase catalytic subunit p20 [Rosellinia necatrix]
MISGRALLIGCDNGELKGTQNDVNVMADILKKLNTHNFDQITCLTGCKATAKNIRASWEKLVNCTNKDDAVVIYYSGHGGREFRPHPVEAGTRRPDKFQYLIPHDFRNDDHIEDWKGILDIEISRWLWEITEKTANVTYILDCCHSANLGKSPKAEPNRKPVAKCQSTNLGSADFDAVWDRARERCMAGIFAGDEAQLGVVFANPDYQNPKVVRIAAAAADSSAWQRFTEGKWRGAMTWRLCQMFDAMGKTRSWLNIMAIVGQLMKSDFDSDPQQPRSAAADDRIPFSLKSDLVTEL